MSALNASVDSSIAAAAVVIVIVASRDTKDDSAARDWPGLGSRAFKTVKEADAKGVSSRLQRFTKVAVDVDVDAQIKVMSVIIIVVIVIAAAAVGDKKAAG
jgi:hypothetical protein